MFGVLCARRPALLSIHVTAAQQREPGTCESAAAAAEDPTTLRMFCTFLKFEFSDSNKTLSRLKDEFNFGGKEEEFVPVTSSFLCCLSASQTVTAQQALQHDAT